MNKKVVISVLMAMCFYTYLYAAITPKDSSEFTYKYEADVLPTAATPAWARATYGPILESVSGGILTAEANDDAANQLYYKDPSWSGMDPYNDGFTIETSFKVTAVGSGKRAFYLQFADGQTYGEIHITDAAIVWNGPIGFTMTTVDTTADFNILRVAKDASSSTYQVWLGDDQIGTNLVGKTTSVERFWIGDWTSNAQGVYEIDYIRSTVGGYSPATISYGTVICVH